MKTPTIQTIKNIRDSIPYTALQLYKRLKEANHSTYIVGGWIRDRLLNSLDSLVIPKYEFIKNDIDFTTSARPEVVMQLFPQSIPTGIKHGTVTVRINNDDYEVTTFRKDGKYQDHRRPENISYAETLSEDLLRRDFTINALAFDLEELKIIDLFNGKNDLEKKVIRVISDGHESIENRFIEDALRMMRGCRFASQLGFTIEPKTLTAINNYAHLIKHISPERIRDELIKLVIGNNSNVGLEYLRTTGLMKFILPELLDTYGVTQNRFHQYDVYYHSLNVLHHLNILQKNNYTTKNHLPNHQLSLAGLFHDIGKPQTKTINDDKVIDGEPHVSFYRHELVGEHMVHAIMKRLRFSNKDINKVLHLIRHHMFHYTSEWKDGTVRRFVAKIGTQQLLEDLLLLRKADRLGKGDVEAEYQENNQDLEELTTRINDLTQGRIYLTIKDLKVNGNEIIAALEIQSGKMVGVILHQLLEKVLDEPKLNEKKILLRLAKELYEKK